MSDSNTFILHAGAVEMNGKAFIFIASTKTGKTTLIAYLSENGFHYINDDEVSINTETLHVLTKVKPLHLRPESLPILQNYGCNITGTEINIDTFHRIMYTPKSVASGDLQIGGLFFISREENQNSCEVIPKSEAVQLLMQNQMPYDTNNSDNLKCAIKLAAKCRRLIYSDMRYVYELIK